MHYSYRFDFNTKISTVFYFILTSYLSLVYFIIYIILIHDRFKLRKVGDAGILLRRLIMFPKISMPN